MGINGDHKPDSPLARLTNPMRLHVKSVRIAINFDSRFRLSNDVEDTFNVTLKRRSSLYQTAEGMAPNFEDGLTHGGNDSFSHLCRIHLVSRVYAGNYDVKLLENSIGVVEIPVCNNI